MNLINTACLQKIYLFNMGTLSFINPANTVQIHEHYSRKLHTVAMKIDKGKA